MGDNDRFFPASMASGSQALSKVGAADDGASRERASGRVGALHPSRGAEDMYDQACTLFRAMVQMPHYKEEVRASMPAFGCGTVATTDLPVVVRGCAPEVGLGSCTPAMKTTTLIHLMNLCLSLTNLVADWRDTSH